MIPKHCIKCTELQSRIENNNRAFDMGRYAEQGNQTLIWFCPLFPDGVPRDFECIDLPFDCRDCENNADCHGGEKPAYNIDAHIECMS